MKHIQDLTCKSGKGENGVLKMIDLSPNRIRLFRILTWKRLRFLFLLQILSAPIPFVAQESRFSKAELLEDLDVFEKSLLGIHPGLVKYTNPSEIRSMLDILRSDLLEKTTKNELLFLLASIIDTIHCGHTNMRTIPASFFKKRFGKWNGLFPLGLREVEKRILVEENLSEDTTRVRPGLQILTINDRHIDSLVSDISKINGGSDGFNTSGKRSSALKFFRNTYFLLYGKQDSFKLRVRDILRDSLFTIVLAGESKKEMKKRAKINPGAKKGTVLELSIPDTLEKTAILKISSFSAYDPWGLIYGRKLKSLFRKIKKQGIEKLVVDLRGNGGGAYLNTKRLLKYSLDTPFVIIDKVSLNRNFYKSKAGLRNKWQLFFRSRKKTEDKLILTKAFQKRLKPKKKYAYDGQLKVLIDKGTYSAASIYAAIVKTHERGELIGEESGGAYFFSNAGLFKYLKLPNTKIIVRIPLIRDEYAVDKTLQSLDRGVLPDIYIENTVDAYFKGLDLPLQKAIDIPD